MSFYTRVLHTIIFVTLSETYVELQIYEYLYKVYVQLYKYFTNNRIFR